MAGFTMPKKGEGAAMLRDLREEERPPREEGRPAQADGPATGFSTLEDEFIPVLTEARTDGRPSGATEASEDVRERKSTGARKQVRPQARTAGRKSASPQGSEDGRAGGRADATGFLGTVEAALASREPLVGGVKATVDMSPELSSRAKRYLADHRGQNTRQVLIALFDAFLTEQGY